MPGFLEWLGLARGGPPITRVWAGALVGVALGWLIVAAIVLVST